MRIDQIVQNRLKIGLVSFIADDSSINRIHGRLLRKSLPQTKNIISPPRIEHTDQTKDVKNEEMALVVRGRTDGDRTESDSSSGKGDISNRRSIYPINGQSDQEDQTCLLKPMGQLIGYSNEWRELAQIISKEIFLNNPNIHWDDIVGLDVAKRLVKEAVVYPIKYPQLFTGILSPWKGLLLYGPPGTGKTLLAKAVATECRTTFFNISASTIVSKWRGDSEKLVRVLFELARFHAPSTIFLDELDSLMSQRGSMSCSSSSSSSADNSSSSAPSEHEGSRRMKTELLLQMDGLAKSNDLVFLLAASNLPWELDHAMLRRLEKRIMVDLPNLEARRRLFENFLPPSPSTTSERKAREGASGPLKLACQIDYDYVAQLTNGYSGSDIQLVCKEAAMRVVRKIFDVLESNSSGEATYYHNVLKRMKLVFELLRVLI